MKPSGRTRTRPPSVSPACLERTPAPVHSTADTRPSHRARKLSSGGAPPEKTRWWVAPSRSHQPGKRAPGAGSASPAASLNEKAALVGYVEHRALAQGGERLGGIIRRQRQRFPGPALFDELHDHSMNLVRDSKHVPVVQTHASCSAGLVPRPPGRAIRPSPQGLLGPFH
jgi:hypothetical protein